MLCSCIFSKPEINSCSSPIQNTIIIRNVYIDDAFTVGEEEDIDRALIAWEKASNNKIKFNSIYRHSEPGELDDWFDKKVYNNSTFIWRRSTFNLTWYLTTKFNMTKYSGIYDRKGNVIIFIDKIKGLDYMFYNVVRHEIGHTLGLEHSTTNNKSTMKINDNEISDCISREDTNRLCALYFCDGKPECN